MPAFHLLRCSVALAGDIGQIVVRDRSQPIVFPELPILQFLHGEEAVTEVYIVGQWDAPNEEVLARLQQLYDPDIVKQVFPGARPRLPQSDSTLPLCTKPVFKPRPVGPDSPDPKLRPLSQFTQTSRTVEAPPLEVESDPTPDEIAAHAQDQDEDPAPDPAEDLGMDLPNPADLPRIVVNTGRRGGSRNQTPTTLPDVAAGGSHSPGPV